MLDSLQQQLQTWLPRWLPPRWVLAVAAGSAVASYLLYKGARILRTDCDLVLMNKSLKPRYFTGKVVWVTGASSGIGEALCHELSRHGALLIMSSRSRDKMEAIQQTLAHPDSAKILPLDLSDPNVTISATEKALQLYGRVDILINNAGVIHRSVFMDMDERTERVLMDTNYWAPSALTKGVIPGMLDQDFGHIVNISSICGKSGMPLRSAYCASKFALQGLTYSLHYEFCDKNLHFTLICPGPVQTSIHTNALGKRQQGESSSMFNTGMTAERCAQLTLTAISNQLLEAWVSPQPALCIPYKAHYCMQRLHSYWRAKSGSFIQNTGQQV